MCMQIRILKSKRFSAVPENYEKKNDLCAIRTIYISYENSTLGPFVYRLGREIFIL